MTEVGIKPRPLGMHLTTDADFYLTRTLRDKATGTPVSWNPGTVVKFVFDSGTAWTATIVGAVATFDVDKAVANTIADGTGVRFVVIDGTRDMVLEIGKVKRHG